MQGHIGGVRKQRTEGSLSDASGPATTAGISSDTRAPDLWRQEPPLPWGSGRDLWQENQLLASVAGDPFRPGVSGIRSAPAADGSLSASLQATVGAISLAPGVIRGDDGDNELGSHDLTSAVAIYGGLGADYLMGGLGDDELYGEDDEDFLAGWQGNDTFDGGGGIDIAYFGDETGAAGLILNLSLTAILYQGLSLQALTGTDTWGGLDTFAALEAVIGSGNADYIYARDTAQAWSLTGGEGNDTLIGGGTDDTLIGGAGDDTFEKGTIFYEGDAGVHVDLIAKTATGQGNDSFVGIINRVLGSAGDDVLIASNFVTTLEGGAGNDVLYGGKANDKLYAGEGLDTLYGSEGNDTLNGDPSLGISGTIVRYDTLTKGRIVADLLDSRVDKYSGTSKLWTDTVRRVKDVYGTSFGDRISGDTFHNLLTGLDGDDVLDGRTGDDELDGGLGADSLLGGADEDILHGGGGNDTLDGGAGADVMHGGAGDDLFRRNDAADAIHENDGSGTDTVETTLHYVLDQWIEHATATGWDDVDLAGNGLDNRLTGNEAANVLDGGAGADRMQGGGGDDVYVIDNLGDLALEDVDGGSDTVYVWVRNYDGSKLANIETIVTMGEGSVIFTTPANLRLAGGGLTAQIEENAAAGAAVGTLLADDDGPAAELRYYMGANDWFEVDAVTGAITVKAGAALDHETTASYSVQVWAVDQNGEGTASDPVTLTIEVANVDEAPTDIRFFGDAGTEIGVPENPLGPLAAVEATPYDPDDGSFIVWGLASGGDAGGLFVIDPFTGQISATRELSYESGVTTYSLTVTATHSLSNESAQQVVTIHVTDVDEGPTSVSAVAETAQAVRVGGQVGNVVVDFAAADPDDPVASPTFQDNRYRFADGDADPDNPLVSADGLFRIDAETGLVTLNRTVEAADLGSVHTFQVVAFRNGFADAVVTSEEYTVTVEATNIAFSDNTVRENSGRGSIVGRFSMSGADGLTWTLEDDAEGRVDLSANGTLTVKNQTKIDSELSPTFDVTVKATDGVSTFVFTKTITVLNVLRETVSGLTSDVPGIGIDDFLRGGAGGDTLNGNIGNDTLSGGAGADRLSGGAGDDAFRFEAALTSLNKDRIVSFDLKDPGNPAVQGDRIELLGTRFNAITAAHVENGILKASAFHVGDAAQDADHRIVYNPVTGEIWYDRDGNTAGGAAANLVATIISSTAKPALTHEYFHIV